VPARNIYHDTVVRALTADGWTITHDPLTISYGGRDLFVDLGAEQSAVAAEKCGRRIAVEVSSFLNPSPVRDIQEAVGRFDVYRALLAELEPDRALYLAVPGRVYQAALTDTFGHFIVNRLHLQLIVFDEQEAKILQWIS
jgi:hypothetical protein